MVVVVLAVRKAPFGRTATGPTTTEVPRATTTTRRATTTRRSAPTGPEGTYDGTEGDFTCSGDADCDDVTPSEGEYVITGSGPTATIEVPDVGTIPAIDSADCAKDLKVAVSNISVCFAGRVDGARCLGQKSSDLYLVAIPPQPWDSSILAVSGRVTDNACGSGTVAGRLTLERSD
jgi:hypothetical protein